MGDVAAADVGKWPAVPVAKENDDGVQFEVWNLDI